jgi:hypothetical protein
MKGDTMKRQNRRGTYGLGTLGFAVLAALALWGLAACRPEKTAPRPAEQLLSMDTLMPVFGEARDVNSGLADFTQSDKEIILSYHLYLTDRTNADKEMARDLAPKIRKFYSHFPSVDRVSFEVSLPDSSSTDDWRPYVSFALTRKLVKESGWSDLLDTDLLSIAVDVKRTE